MPAPQIRGAVFFGRYHCSADVSENGMQMREDDGYAITTKVAGGRPSCRMAIMLGKAQNACGEVSRQLASSPRRPCKWRCADINRTKGARRSMEKFWVQSYPQGVPAEIDCTQYRSLVHLLEDAFQKYAKRHAYVCMDKFLTYEELNRLSSRLGAWLLSLGRENGGRVALLMPNVLQYPVAIAAVLRAGYTVVNVNPLYTPRELEYQLNDSGAEAIIILENFATTLEKVIHATRLRHVVVATMGDLLGGAKGAIVNFVVRHVKKLVPPFSLPNAVSFKRALAQSSD